MTTDTQRCRARTKSGEPCRNAAQRGQDYCYAHRRLGLTVEADQAPAAAVDVEPVAAAQAPPAVETAATPVKPTVHPLTGYDLLIHELDALVRELQRQIPAASPFARLVSRQPAPAPPAEEIPPSPTWELLVQLRDSIMESTVQDLLDRETWQGLWLVAQVALQTQMEEAQTRLDARLGIVPGYRTARARMRNTRASPNDESPA